MSYFVEDHQFMAQALRLAARGLYTTTPNPRVGCVIVHDGIVAGSGWHEHAGGSHAEIIALQAAGASAHGATMYVTLEPCHHHGRTPPCDETVVAAGVKRVVVAMQDPDVRTAGQGIARLRAAGISVEQGLMEAEARELNLGFSSRVTHGRPWVRVKIAASLDGKTALNNGNSRWITGQAARCDGHRWRARACAVLSGIGTVRTDDPWLTVREVETPRQPLRVIVDSTFAIAPTARILEGGGALIVSAVTDAAKIAQLREHGAEVMVLPGTAGRVDLPALLAELAKRGVNEMHVEAGSRLNGALLETGCVDELLLYLAPGLIGDRARGMFDVPELTDLTKQRKLSITDSRMIGKDVRMLVRFA